MNDWQGWILPGLVALEYAVLGGFWLRKRLAPPPPLVSGETERG